MVMPYSRYRMGKKRMLSAGLDINQDRIFFPMGDSSQNHTVHLLRGF